MAIVRLRDQLKDFVPWWLSDRYYSSGKTVGYRILWAIVAALDLYLEYVLQALQAAWPGKGTPTALAYIGRSRGILRGQADTDDTYGAKLRGWLDKWAGAGSQRRLALEIHEYLGNSPRVRIVNRAGHWVMVAADGTVTTADVAFNWDGTSHTGRAGYWSEMFIAIYPSQWAHTAISWGSGTWGEDGEGLGHNVSRVEYDAVRGLTAQWKSAHSLVRAIIWTSDATLFDPAAPASLPNGSWGAWGTTGAAARVASSRNLTTCRYWEL